MFRFSIFSDPETKLNNNNLQNDVDSNNNESNTLSKNLRPKDIVSIVFTDWFIKDNLSLLNLLIFHVFLCAVFLFKLAETLHSSFVVSRFFSGCKCEIDFVLVDGVVLPLSSLKPIILLKLLAVNLWILVLLSKRSFLSHKDDSKGAHQKEQND